MTAPSDGDRQVRGPRELESAGDIGGGSAAYDHRRPLVDHGVMERPSLVVSGVVGHDYLRIQPGAWFVGCGCQDHGPQLLASQVLMSRRYEARRSCVMTMTRHF